MKLTGDDVYIGRRKTLKFQSKIQTIAYFAVVQILAHFIHIGAGFEFQNVAKKHINKIF
jgi:hypothetical protein